jgi:hypothetical protein
MEHYIAKALEVWSLQILLNTSILCGILATGLAMVQNYYRALEKQLSLRVSIELWKVLTVLAVDILLAVAVLIGSLLLNLDIMADIKMAVPFCPIATVLLSAALVLRLFHGGHEVGSPNYLRSLGLMLAANAFNIVGYTFVMEAASDEYLAIHPNACWEYIKAHFRSGASPYGLELSQITFHVCFPLLVAVLGWGAWSALRQVRAGKSE